MKKALITGINGQDGSYLSELLIDKGYEVHGILRRHSVAENQDARIASLDIKTHYGDLTDEVSLFKILNAVKPDEIYNLGAMSHVGISNQMPAFTIKTNSLSVISLLEFTKEICPECRVYQASSSEMFGNSIEEDGFQKLTTPMNPVSPYGCSKVMAYNLIKFYRQAYNKFYCNGILFNHESPRRGSNFVTNKVIKSVVMIKKKLLKKLELGNMDSQRDWGHSKDYVKAMHLIMEYEKPSDWIVSTGETRSIRDFCEYAFKLVDLNYLDYVEQNKKYMRPLELDVLRGDSSETRKLLNWKPDYTFESMIEEMIEYWMKKI
ncbi:GDP-mannose 4,6-dehydratase [Alphaproteobacteria bacterium]|nr:GDP-mannose 4,6-dehydratase [Alphaproteobacteria bacterium]